MPGSNSRPNVSEGYEVPTELPGSTGYMFTCTLHHTQGVYTTPYTVVRHTIHSTLHHTRYVNHTQCVVQYTSTEVYTSRYAVHHTPSYTQRVLHDTVRYCRVWCATTLPYALQFSHHASFLSESRRLKTLFHPPPPRLPLLPNPFRHHK